MRIPRKIEWRAGAALLGAAITLLILLIVLTLTRTDVGVEVEGSLSGAGRRWVLVAEIPTARLRLLRQCRYARVQDGEGPERDGPISRISGRWTPGREGVLARIEIAKRAPRGETIPNAAGRKVRAAIIQRQNVPVLKVLVETVFRRPGS